MPGNARHYHLTWVGAAPLRPSGGYLSVKKSDGQAQSESAQDSRRPRHTTVFMTRSKQEVVEVLTGPERRRRWTPDEKRAMVRESCEPTKEEG